jgi:hypothetical protein
MKSASSFWLARTLGWGVLAGLAWFQCQPLARAQLAVERLEVRADGTLELDFPGNLASYYRLLSGSEVDQIESVVDLSLEPPLVAILENEPARYFRVQQVSRAQSLDTDGDGIPDVYELQHPVLNPLNPADAGLDLDGSGRTALQVYLESLAPTRLTTVMATSPADGERGVSVHRETIFRLSVPLAPDVLPRPEQVYATTGTRRLLSRVEVSSDRRQITLFYLEPLPAGTRVTAVLDTAGLRDIDGVEVDGDGNGQPGGMAVIAFDTFGSVGLANTAVIGQVFASELGSDDAGQPRNQPLQGVIVTVDGAEETLRAVTDAEGRFTLSPAPAGRFFVHIDGRTALGSQWPNGAYYPFIGKAWEAVPGKLDNLAGGTGIIYLPLVAAGTLQPVSATADTVVTFPPATLAAFPELAGVAVTVPANALFSDDGMRGGRVGIAPVPSDRLPEPLPPGVEMPLVITIQTDGPTNFDQPVPVRFPNLPDPVTGRRLPPGAKTALVSFNHDTGVWEVSGPMTVSEDGLFVDSDPGTGVRQPGWHGTAPVASGSGGGYGSGESGSPGRSGSGRRGGGSDGNNDLAPDLVTPEESGFGDDSENPGADSAQDDESNSSPEYEDPQTGSGPGPCDSLDVRIMVKRPFEGSGLPSADSFVRPDPPSADGKLVPYRVMPNQLVRVRFDVPEGGSVSYSAAGGNPGSGSGPEFVTRFRPNISTNLALTKITVIVTNGDGDSACGEALIEVLPLSGSHWVEHFAAPKAISELREPFRSNVEGFVKALTEVGATVSIASTFRSQKRAYLMHVAGKVKEDPTVALNPREFRAQDIPDHDPFKGPLNITFAHLNAQGELDLAATRAAAAAMCSGYQIVYPAGYPATRHGDRRAIDMTIRWDGTKQFRLGSPLLPMEGSGELFDYLTIAARKCVLGNGKPPDEHCNGALWLLGESWGVIKLRADKPHWSDDGR